MKSSQIPTEISRAAAEIDWGATFLNRFDLKVRKAGRLTVPTTGEQFRIDPSLQPVSCKRVFGEVEQFRLSAGIFGISRLSLTAVSLSEESSRPGKDILRLIAGPSGLDLPEREFHCIGIFSPAGWTEERQNTAELRGNALYYLVQKQEGTLWSVFGPEGPLKQLYDPEIQEEKVVRARNTLASHPRLLLPGDPVALDIVGKEHRIDPEILVMAIQASEGLFEIIKHKGKSYIQRCIP